MSRSMNFPIRAVLIVVIALSVSYSSLAEDKPSIKSPSPIKPLPPAKPTDPLKPQDPIKPRGTDRTADAGPPLLVGAAADKATREALAKRVALDFTDAPLSKVVDSLTEQTKLAISVAAKDTTAADSEAKQKATIHVSGITAASALDLVTRDLGWKWFADQGSVVITDEDQIHATVQVYNVRDLVLTHPGGGNDETLDFEYSPLADIITGAIVSPAWSHDGGPLEDCTPFHGTVTITQDEKVQEQVAGLLSALRKSREAKPQTDETAHDGLGIEPVDQTAIEAALGKGVAAQPTAAKLDDLAEWIRRTYGVGVHVDAKARVAGLPNTAIADTGGATPDAKSKPDSAPMHAAVAPSEHNAKPHQQKPEDPNREPSKPVQPQPEPAKSEQSKPDQPQPEQTKPDETKPEQPGLDPGPKVDVAAKPAVAVSPAAPASVVGMSLEDALETLFADSNLGFSIRDEVLLITTKDEAKSLRTVRVFPVGDLIDGEIDKDGVDEEYARLLDVITKAVEPDSWATLDKPKAGTAYISYLPQGRAIVCSHSRDAQKEVAEILEKVRKAIAEQGTTTDKPAGATTASSGNKPAARPLTTKIYKLNADLPADDFVAVVKDLVEPLTWIGGEAYIHGVPGAIIVKQTGAIQKRVEKILIDLGAIPDPRKSPPSGTPTLVGRLKHA